MVGLELDFLGAEGNAGWEIGQALERKVLGWCVAAGGHEFVGGVEDGLVNVVGGLVFS